MLNFVEAAIMRNLQTRDTVKTPVTASEKQWVLAMLAKEKMPVPACVTLAAEKAGFNVAGIVTYNELSA